MNTKHLPENITCTKRIQKKKEKKKEAFTKIYKCVEFYFAWIIIRL
jgi:hypothetical protein